MFLEDTQQFLHDISAVLSDDIEKFFDQITTQTQIVTMYQHVCSRHGYVKWVAETGHHPMALFTTRHTQINLMALSGVKQGLSFSYPLSKCVASFKSKSFFPPPPTTPEMAMLSNSTHNTRVRLHTT